MKQAIVHTLKQSESVHECLKNGQVHVHTITQSKYAHNKANQMCHIEAQQMCARVLGLWGSQGSKERHSVNGK
jgi:tRNA isopentenyl-2-thiomethyl-A-37 hydroxylase MiaE